MHRTLGSTGGPLADQPARAAVSSVGRHGYSPDQQEGATELVIEQAELMGGELAA